MGLLTSLFSLFSAPASATPAQIVILRHAEKPPVGPELSTEGWQRANALPQLFSAMPDLRDLGAPAALVAMSPSRPGRSVRSIQTLTPLSNQLGLPLETQYRGRDFKKMIREVLSRSEYSGKQVVVCWRREEIPSIVESLTGEEIDKVKSREYDGLWILRADRGGGFSVEVERQGLPVFE